MAAATASAGADDNTIQET
jgi:hypothetical protein